MAKWIKGLLICLIIFLPMEIAKGLSITDNQVVESNKTWKINFNKEIQLDEVTKQGITVTSSKGIIIQSEVKLGQDSKSILVLPPTNGYDKGETYTLKIGTKVHSKDAKNLNKEVILNYSIRNDANPILSTKEIISKYGKAIVAIEAQDENKEIIGSGSGFIVNTDGIVVTNYHVIDWASYAKVTTQSGIEYEVESVLNYDKEQDIAVLKLKNASNLTTVVIGDSSQVEVADQVLAIGNPEGLSNTVSTGIISGLNRDMGRPYKDIQTSASIAPGSSGGALFNTYGQVIGITYAGYDNAGDLGFVIPINEVKPFLSNFVPKSLIEVNAIALNSKLIAPTGVDAWPISDDELVIQWDPVEGADGYYVYYSNDKITWKYFSDNYGKKKLLYWYDIYSAGLYDLEPGEKVYFKVSYVKNGIESHSSYIVSATTYGITYFPLMSTVPKPYAEYDEYNYNYDKKFAGYAYYYENIWEDFVEDYEYLLYEQGWSLVDSRVLEDGIETFVYEKNGIMVSISIWEDFVLIAGDIH